MARVPTLSPGLAPLERVPGGVERGGRAATTMTASRRAACAAANARRASSEGALAGRRSPRQSRSFARADRASDSERRARQRPMRRVLGPPRARRALPEAIEQRARLGDRGVERRVVGGHDAHHEGGGRGAPDDDGARALASGARRARRGTERVREQAVGAVERGRDPRRSRASPRPPRGSGDGEERLRAALPAAASTAYVPGAGRGGRCHGRARARPRPAGVRSSDRRRAPRRRPAPASVLARTATRKGPARIDARPQRDRRRPRRSRGRSACPAGSIHDGCPGARAPPSAPSTPAVRAPPARTSSDVRARVTRSPSSASAAKARAARSASRRAWACADSPGVAGPWTRTPMPSVATNGLDLARRPPPLARAAAVRPSRWRPRRRRPRRLGQRSAGRRQQDPHLALAPLDVRPGLDAGECHAMVARSPMRRGDHRANPRWRVERGEPRRRGPRASPSAGASATARSGTAVLASTTMLAPPGAISLDAS